MLTVQQIKDTVADYFKDKPVKQVYFCVWLYTKRMQKKQVM